MVCDLRHLKTVAGHLQKKSRMFMFVQVSKQRKSKYVKNKAAQSYLEPS